MPTSKPDIQLDLILIEYTKTEERFFGENK